MSSGGKVNILIVDDRPENLQVLESILAELDVNLFTARSGAEALQQVLRHDFAVILLDVNMPNMDGYEVAAFIRQRRKSAHTPIIFITAYADEVHQAQGYSLGAVDYILAPVVPEVLRSKVRVFVELFRMTQEVKQHADERVALAQEQAARAAAEEANRRSTFLAEASAALASSLDYHATVRHLARLVVPFLADWSAVTLVAADGPSPPTELAWVDARADGGVRTASAPDGLPAPLAELAERALQSGKREAPAEMADGPEPFAICNPQAAMAQAVVLPLRARDKVLGTLALALGERRFGPADLALADDLADRAAVFLDNARLHRDIQDANRRKNEFLSMLAHELRNPLAPIRNATEILRRQGPHEATLDWAREVIDRNVHQLSRLVDDLLDVSRITRGKIRLQREPVEMAAVVAQAVEISQPLIHGRKHQLAVALPPEPVWVNGDSTRLAQVLANLLNNAAKYTDEGGRIWLTLERAGGEVVVRVRDTGVGIPPEMLGSVFDLFTQVDRSLDRSQGGLGIGLTLVRRLVEMHGGSVAAYSGGPNQGSEFVVRLPALAAPPPPRPSENGSRREPVVKSARRRVLVVDDNVDAAEGMALLLRLSGHEVRTAHDGPSALGAVDAFRPELVLLDIGLPRMDGYEVARRLRARPELAALRLVAITGYGQEEDRQRCKEAGFDQHLVKPVDPQVLQQLLGSGPQQGTPSS
jgi:signal transduction histidine kinase/DNA-binding response OmpR family regulator